MNWGIEVLVNDMVTSETMPATLFKTCIELQLQFSYLFGIQQGVKGKPKSNNEQDINDEKLHEGIQNTCKHNNVYSKLRKLPQEQYKGYPRKED